MPRRCGSPTCTKTVEPVAVEFRTDRYDGWFLVCPVCHYVFGRIDDPPPSAEG